MSRSGHESSPRKRKQTAISVVAEVNDAEEEALRQKEKEEKKREHKLI
jgi:hypothetical protein